MHHLGPWLFFSTSARANLLTHWKKITTKWLQEAAAEAHLENSVSESAGLGLWAGWVGMPAGLGPAEPAITTLIGPGAPPPTPGLHTCTEHRSDFGLIIIAYTHTHPFTSPLSGTTRVSWYQKGKTSLDFTEATNSERQWNPLGHMQASTLLQTDNHTSTYHSVFYRPDALPAAKTTASKHWRHMWWFSPMPAGFRPAAPALTMLIDPGIPTPRLYRWGHRTNHTSVYRWGRQTNQHRWMSCI